VAFGGLANALPRTQRLQRRPFTGVQLFSAIGPKAEKDSWHGDSEAFPRGMIFLEVGLGSFSSQRTLMSCLKLHDFVTIQDAKRIERLLQLCP
jgi:hypothetical protein